MFADAYEKASGFTHPVVLSLRFFDKTVECRLASFIVLNPEGWIVTVAHLFEPHLASKQHSRERNEYSKKLAAIEQNAHLSTAQRQKEIRRLKSNPKWITDLSFWWGLKGSQAAEFTAFPEADLAIGRLQPFDPKSISTYPILKNPANLRLGTSLCKLGFPLHQIKATFDEKSNSFKFQRGALPVPRFPIEGIATRHIAAGKSRDGKHEIKFLETSSPGLKGQSGGPIFDADGTVWAIQSRTATIPLGFSATVENNGRQVEENQLLSVGWGVHPETMVTFLQDNNISFQLSDC